VDVEEKYDLSSAAEGFGEEGDSDLGTGSEESEEEVPPAENEF
jgi:hypothetical protein